MKSICILGRQPAIGRAELESLLGAAHVAPAGDSAMLSDLAPGDVPFERLGGSVKLGEILGAIDTLEWPKLQREVTRLAVRRAQELPEGKIQLGLSAYGLQVTPSRLGGTGLELKKQLRNAGYSVRLIPNKETALSSAQTLHNHLAGERGLDLLLVRSGNKVIVARTTAVQDITAYAQRDQGRPKRDARVGMLPPKLAQIIVNLAVATTPPSIDKVVLDPFCGTGVVLQETLLMGYSAYGTDLDQRMVDYSVANVHDWFYMKNHPELRARLAVALGDATDKIWEDDVWDGKKNAFDWRPAHIDFVASETYLGRPLSQWPKPETLKEIIGTCDTVIKKFLQNIHTQILPGMRLCLAVPAWRNPDGRLHHLALLDHLGEIGYNRVRFEHVRDAELVYFRPEQLVARELLVITRK